VKECVIGGGTTSCSSRTTRAIARV
jgi:hypothetical protein